MEAAVVPAIVARAWAAYGDPRTIVSTQEASMMVSTNQVFRMALSDGSRLITKVSSYGSYWQYREDHDRIRVWYNLLQGTRYKNLLSDALLKGDRVFSFVEGGVWVIFYHEVPARARLPRILSEAQIVNFAQEMARFHKTCAKVSRGIPLTTKSIKSDIIHLHFMLSDVHCREQFNYLTAKDIDTVLRQCDEFLGGLDEMGYDYWDKIPVLIDWNLGNFSVQFDEAGDFTLFSRWDYDWFRIEPRALDFYFCSRVVSSIGDRTNFSYLADPLVDDRFRLFLKTYDRINPLAPEDILFLKEAYRFFILNYVIKDGEHFFLPYICRRLEREALDEYLPRLGEYKFSGLLDVI